jgi:undecaprenyl-diphosphatase
MAPLQALDTRAFLTINGLPHPPLADLMADTITIVTTGGWIWLLGIALTRRAGLHDRRGALRLAAPCIVGATWFVDVPVKALFRRRRPFIDIVRALVVGRRPDGWSFPSGHSAAAFSGAWILSTLWPSRTPLFFTLAASVGFSRVYVGAHYPGDVISGATLGAVVAEALRRPVARWLS